MKKFISLIIIILHTQLYANMASPVFEGTLGSRPFINEYVDVVHEDLLIKIDKDFKNANYKITYHINATKEGVKIPFLFYASEYLDSFTIKIDGIEVGVQKVPIDIEVPENTKFNDFSYFFEKDKNYDHSEVAIDESSTRGFRVRLKDMIYFEADISKGSHKIEVNYRANSWVDNSDWVKEYSFRYALSPAKYWKSFGTLKVTLLAADFDKEISTNIGPQSKGDLQTKAVWNFDKLPTDILQINYVPKISKTAQVLVFLGPEGLALITAIILVLLHLFIVFWYRKKYTNKRFSIVVIIGSIIIPFVFLLSWIFYYSFIDNSIGEHAGKRHGYTIFIFITYPVIVLIYGIILWFIDHRLKKKYINKSK